VLELGEEEGGADDLGELAGAVGEGRHSEGSGAVEGGQRLDAGGGDVVDVAGLGRGGPCPGAFASLPGTARLPG